MYFDEAVYDAAVYDEPYSFYTSSPITAVWHEQSFVQAPNTLKWHEQSFVQAPTVLLWNEQLYLQAPISFPWNEQSFVQAPTVLLWDEQSFVQAPNTLKWHEQSFVQAPTALLWNEQSYLQAPISFPWNEQSFVQSPAILPWNEQSFVQSPVILKWHGLVFVSSPTVLLWHEGPPIKFPLKNYLEITTPQGRTLFPRVDGGSITKRSILQDSAEIRIWDPVPEDSACRLYMNGDIKLFDGITRSCIKKMDNMYYLSALEYTEILKPSSPKGGLYLLKWDWHDTQLQYLISSNRPDQNNNTVGLVYMAVSGIPYEFFELHDNNYDIYKWQYYGITYNITEVLEEATALTPRASVAALQSGSGWYHDTATNTLYVRCTDGADPYYHIISVPYIWDGNIPVRIGQIKSKGTTIIKYWETANGDVPLDSLDNLLYALGLERETVVRGGYAYIDISEHSGNGTANSPANIYDEKYNVLNLSELTISDARYTVNGVKVGGYGSGAGAITAGVHRNMGRGGRFVIINDASIHDQDVAEDYAENYLNEMYLPSRSAKFTAKLKDKDIVDVRAVGDTVRAKFDSQKYEQDLRIQEIKIDLDNVVQDITVGDKLITYEQRLQAMKAAADKFRSHLEDEIDTFSWNWSENLTYGTNIENKFTVTNDILSVQKLELTCSTDFFRADMPKTTGAGGGSSGEAVGGHTHTFEEGAVTAGPSATETVASGSHTHTVAGITVAPDNNSIYVASNSHTHALTNASAASGGSHTHYFSTSGSTSSNSGGAQTATSGVSGSYGCCTAVGCGQRFVTGVSSAATVSCAPSGHIHSFSVAANTGSGGSHTHTLSGSTEQTNSFTAVSASGHTHTLSGSTEQTNSFTAVSGSGHTHTLSGNVDTCTDTKTVGSGTHTHSLAGITIGESGSSTQSPYHEYSLTRIKLKSNGDIPSTAEIETGGYTETSVKYGQPQVSLAGSDPEMYLHITINGSDIPGSPFVIHVKDSIGTVLISDMITGGGEYTVKMKLVNKDNPDNDCHIRFSLQISGRIFVDTIIG